MLVILVLADAVFEIKRREHILQDAKKNIIRAQAKQKAAYDRRHCHPEVFRVGAMVLKKDFTRKKRKGGKLDPKWKDRKKLSTILDMAYTAFGIRTIQRNC